MVLLRCFVAKLTGVLDSKTTWKWLTSWNDPSFNITVTWIFVYQVHWFCNGMALSLTTSGRGSTSRGRGKRNRGAIQLDQPNTSGGKTTGRNPINNIINDMASTYHEGTAEEIHNLIDEWGVELNK